MREACMKYAVVFTYPADTSRIQETRPEHRKYLTSLKEQGKLVAAGPFAGDTGALIIYEAETEDETRGLIEADPFYHVGVFAHLVIKPWTRVF
jgi:uncharacterized protein YciI